MKRVMRQWGGGAFLAMLMGTVLGAQPQLTKIEDTIYGADGRRFRGQALIEWRSFLTSDGASIVANSKTVNIVDGVLSVSLVPTTTAPGGAYYYVRYLSSTHTQVEYWAVAPSATPVKLKDVRIAAPPPARGSLPPGAGGTVYIEDVEGLADELSARPKKGPGYAAARAAVIGATGELEGADGAATDCVRVDGSAGPCGATGPQTPLKYVVSFSGQTAVAVPGAVHQLGTDIVVECRDNGSPEKRVEPDSVTVNTITGDVSITFAQGQTGRCILM